MLDSARGYMFVFPPDALGALGPGTGCTNTTRRVAVTGGIFPGPNTQTSESVDQKTVFVWL